MSLDLTAPLSIAIFFLGLVVTLLVVLPRVSALRVLREALKATNGRTQALAEDLAAFKQKDFAKYSALATELQKDVSTLRGAVAVKQIGR